MAPDLGLHCLPMSHKKDARLIWVKDTIIKKREKALYGTITKYFESSILSVLSTKTKSHDSLSLNLFCDFFINMAK